MNNDGLLFMFKAAEAHQRQVQASRKQQSLEANSKDDLLKEVMSLLEPRENIVQVGTFNTLAFIVDISASLIYVAILTNRP